MKVIYKLTINNNIDDYKMFVFFPLSWRIGLAHCYTLKKESNFSQTNTSRESVVSVSVRWISDLKREKRMKKKKFM